MPEYKCTGSCVCENQERSVSTTQSLSLIKGLIYLVAACSSIKAFNLAKTHFEKSCFDSYRNICPEHSIRASVDDCADGDDDVPPRRRDDDDDETEFIDHSRDDEFDNEYMKGEGSWNLGDDHPYFDDHYGPDAKFGHEDVLDEHPCMINDPDKIVRNEFTEEVEMGKKNDMIFARMRCTGHCLTKQFSSSEEELFLEHNHRKIKENPEKMQTFADSFGCEEMFHEDTFDQLQVEKDELTLELQAVDTFTQVTLAMYCEDHTMARVSSFEKKGGIKVLEKNEKKDEFMTSICIGFEREEFKNPSVKCKRIETVVGWDYERDV